MAHIYPFAQESFRFYFGSRSPIINTSPLKLQQLLNLGRAAANRWTKYQVSVDDLIRPSELNPSSSIHEDTVPKLIFREVAIVEVLIYVNKSVSKKQTKPIKNQSTTPRVAGDTLMAFSHGRTGSGCAGWTSTGDVKLLV